MIAWSKLKKAVESHFALSVIGRVELRSTRYRKAHDDVGRGWITVDKKEAWNLCTFKYWHALYESKKKIQARRDVSIMDAYRLASTEIENQGILSQERFYDMLDEYCSLSIERALASENVLIQALAMLDKRLGKRKLRSLKLESNAHPMVQYFFKFRLKAEGIDTGGMNNEATH